MTKAIILGIFLCFCVEFSISKLNGNNPKFSNLWVAKIEGGEEVAQRIARDLGYTYKGQCGEIENYYELIREDHPEVSLRDSDHLTTSLLNVDEVKWASQQMLVRRAIHPMPKFGSVDDDRALNVISYLKGVQSMKSDQGSSCKSLFSCISYYPPRIFSYFSTLNQHNLENLGTYPTTPAPRTQLYSYSRYVTMPINLRSQKLSAYILKYNDPYWRKQWNMQDYRTKEMPVMDLNVVPVHKMGITGKGVTVAVVDNGVEHFNFDFSSNFISRLSYDMCKDIPGSRPTGHPHGTNCAGVIAMNPDNKLCGVGIAYDAKIVGIRAICDDEQAHSATAKALRHGLKEIDIYSNSWGFQGEGMYVFGKDHLSDESLYQGVTKGRDGKGVVYVRSAGNDKDEGDNCAVDPDINTPYAITIAGADQFGEAAYYSERCTAIMATTYTLSKNTEGIVAPDIGEGCVTDFSGTSAACPQASGIIALVLEANPDLTYRDVMHLITWSAEVAPLAANEKTWYQNGRGLWVSNDFGFGLMNAENMVRLAKKWQNVPEKKECIVSVELESPVYFDYENDAEIEIDMPACKGRRDEVNYIEHIELASVVEYPYRGDIMVYITSPAGTTSVLLEPRAKDNDPDGLEGWPIVSTHNWGEVSRGPWTVTYRITSKAHSYSHGYAHSFTLTLHGTKERPAHYDQDREYAAFRLVDGDTN